MIVIAPSLVLSPVAASLSLNNPTILYRNFRDGGRHHSDVGRG